MNNLPSDRPNGKGSHARTLPPDATQDAQESLAVAALQNSVDAYLREIVSHTNRLKESDGYPEYHSPQFHFARFCKAHPGLTDLPDHEAVRQVERIMSAWDELPEGMSPWEYFFPDTDDPDTAREDFMNSWASIRHIPFKNVLENAVRLADGRPIKPSIERTGRYERFISVAYWLQRCMGDKPILCPTRTFAEILECDQATISRLRFFAKQDGLLVEVGSFKFRSERRRKATEFRFAVERFEEVKCSNDATHESQDSQDTYESQDSQGITEKENELPNLSNSSPSGFSPSKSKAEKANNRKSDSRHAPCIRALRNYWNVQNKETGLAMPFSGRTAKQIQKFFVANPKLTVDEFVRCLHNRANSDGIIPTEDPVSWIPYLLRFESGPLNRFNKPKSAAEGRK